MKNLNVAERRRRPRPPRRGGSRPEPGRARSPGARLQRDARRLRRQRAQHGDRRVRRERLDRCHQRVLVPALGGTESKSSVFPPRARADVLAEVIVTHACELLSRAVCASATARARLARDVFRNVPARARARRAKPACRRGARRRARLEHRARAPLFSFFFFPPEPLTDRRLARSVRVIRVFPRVPSSRSRRVTRIRCATARRWRSRLCSRRLSGT